MTDQVNGAQVPRNQNGGSTGMPQNGQQGDVGTDDLDARLNTRVQDIANGFKSTIDKRFAPIERVAQTVPQLQQQIGAMNQQLAEIRSFFTTAQEADLDPDERERRQQTRRQQESQQREASLVFNSRQQNAAFRASVALGDMGYKWNDPRLEWYHDLYQTDPDVWASQVVSNAARTYAAELAQQQQTRDTQVVDVAQRRSRELQARQQIGEQNAQRGAQANALETQPPGGPQMDWMEKVRQMTPEEKTTWIRRQQYRIQHGEITQPGQ